MSDLVTLKKPEKTHWFPKYKVTKKKKGIQPTTTIIYLLLLKKKNLNPV